MTTTTIDLDTLHLKGGGHHGPESGACLLEAVSWFAGEPWSDRPACTSELLAAAGRSLNDAIKDQAERDALKDLIPHLVGTANDGLDEQRSAMAWAFYVNRWVPAWMRLTPALADHVVALEAVDTTDKATTLATLRAAQKASASAAAWAPAAARDAASAAARDAAWDAAWAAARDAASAWAEVRAAAWDAVRAAARDALKQTADDLRAEFTVVYRAMVMLEATS